VNDIATFAGIIGLLLAGGAWLKECAANDKLRRELADLQDERDYLRRCTGMLEVDRQKWARRAARLQRQIHSADGEAWRN
jgi:hypothetical protein